jgi:RimJ/RimL family protein N-acetyltransferase
MKQTKLTIRDATEADAEAIVAMHDQSWLDTYPNDTAGVSREWVKERIGKWQNPEKIEARRELIRRSGQGKATIYRIAEDEYGKVVGLISPYRDEKTQRVGAIYVDKQYHGTGLAQKLMDEIIAWADQSRVLELEVASYNERAKAFYRKYNFKEIEHSEHTVHEVIPVVTMIRKGDKQ